MHSAAIMNADRMIAVFLSGVLVGGAVVYLASNNGLSSGFSPGHQGSQTNSNGQGGGGPAGGQPNAGAKGATPSGDIGAASAASAAPSGSAPGAPGSLENGPAGGAQGGMMDATASGGAGGAGGEGSEGGGEDVPSPIAPVPVSGAPQGATRLLRHLQLAPTLWKAQAEDALQSASPKSRALASDIATHATTVPIVSDKLPQTPNIVSYLVDSKLLLIRMKEAGMDIDALETQIDEVSRARK